MGSTVEGAGVELAYEERGQGPGVVLVHGMASSAADLLHLAEPLEREARVVAYDRRGYGASGAPEPYERTTVNEQAEDLAALIRALDLAPCVALGVDLGALAVVDVLRRHPGCVSAAVLVDPPLYAFVADATEALAAERLALEDALRADGPGHAVELYLGWHHAPSDRVARARASSAAFFADYGGLASLSVARADLRALEVPLAVLDSDDARPHQRAASDALGRLAPHATRGEGDVVRALRGMLGS
jgi:pimeloyl-ACP methyl ester carboxylesterase